MDLKAPRERTKNRGIVHVLLSAEFVDMNVHPHLNTKTGDTSSEAILKVERLSFRSHEVIFAKKPSIERSKRSASWSTLLKCISERTMRPLCLLFTIIWITLQITVWTNYHSSDISTTGIPPIERSSRNLALMTTPSTNTTIPTRKTDLLQFSTMTNENHTMDSYSGMWWVRRDVFVSHWDASMGCRNYEAASYKMFNAVSADNIYLTRDWLDLSVEHLSHYFKLLDVESLPAAEGILQAYLEAPTMTKSSKTRHSVVHETLAVLPVHFSDPDVACDGVLVNDAETLNEKNRCLYMYSLSATLKSLWRAGIPRVILAGNFPEEPPIVQQAIRLFHSVGPGRDGSNIDIQYVYVVSNEGHNNGIPCDALDQLQSALSYYMTGDARAQWLGNDPATQERWRYIYFSEPDLVLHARLLARSGIPEALEQGKLLTAHRFQLMKHEVNAPPQHPDVYSLFLPNHEKFSDLINLNDNNNDADNGDDNGYDSCCDAGNWWPGVDDSPKCDSWWYLCGYQTGITDRDEAYRNHYRLWAYPNVRLLDGLNVPVVQAHGRVCLPRRGGCGSTSTTSTASDYDRPVNS